MLCKDRLNCFIESTMYWKWITDLLYAIEYNEYRIECVSYEIAWQETCVDEQFVL